MGADRADRRARRRGRGDRAGLRPGRDRAGGVPVPAGGRVGRARDRRREPVPRGRRGADRAAPARPDGGAAPARADGARCAPSGTPTRRRRRSRACATRRAATRTCCRRCARRCARAARSARSATCCATSGGCTTRSARLHERSAQVPPRHERRGGRHGRGRGAHARDASDARSRTTAMPSACRSRRRSPGRSSATAPRYVRTATHRALARRAARSTAAVTRARERCTRSRRTSRHAEALYSFDALTPGLVRVGEGDARSAVAAAVGASAETFVVLTGVHSRTGWKYMERGYRHVWWDAGTMLANLLALAAADDLGPGSTSRSSTPRAQRGARRRREYRIRARRAGASATARSRSLDRTALLRRCSGCCSPLSARRGGTRLVGLPGSRTCAPGASSRRRRSRRSTATRSRGRSAAAGRSARTRRPRSRATSWPSC